MEFAGTVMGHGSCKNPGNGGSGGEQEDEEAKHWHVFA